MSPDNGSSLPLYYIFYSKMLPHEVSGYDPRNDCAETLLNAYDILSY